MILRLNLFLALIATSISFAQRQTIASQGGTYETTSKILVSQSIGQASVIGGFGSKNAQVIQGFQQPYWTGLISQNLCHSCIDTRFHYEKTFFNIYSNFIFSYRKCPGYL